MLLLCGWLLGWVALVAYLSAANPHGQTQEEARAEYTAMARAKGDCEPYPTKPEPGEKIILIDIMKTYCTDAPVTKDNPKGEKK
jgi:hypothetical protein